MSGVARLGNALDRFRNGGVTGWLVSKVRDRILNHFPQWDLSDEFVATRKLQIACKRCHQGWMSRIDAMAKPMALPLIKGETAIIGPSSQAALAAWAAKTVMIAELTSTSGRVTPECERMELRQKQRPPQSWNIWAAFSNGVECEASYVRHTARLRPMAPPTPIRLTVRTHNRSRLGLVTSCSMS